MVSRWELKKLKEITLQTILILVLSKNRGVFEYPFQKVVSLCRGTNPAPILSSQEEPPSMCKKNRGFGRKAFGHSAEPSKKHIRYSPSWNKFRGFCTTKTCAFFNALKKSHIIVRHFHFLSTFHSNSPISLESTHTSHNNLVI